MVDCAPPRATTASVIRVGCAGWTLPGHVAASFPGAGSHLERYARVFPSVEINSSFYRPHQSKTYERWAASVPEAFRFSVKIPKMISHELRLQGADVALGQFLEEITPLGEKLGCLLLQLPPSLRFDPLTARTFFSLLRNMTSVRVACEPRHATWFTEEARRAMKEAAIACVLADPAPVPDASPLGDSGTLYLRLHGTPRIYYSAYDETFLDAIAEQVTWLAEPGREIWCMFDNTAHGAAVPDALTLMDKLGARARPGERTEPPPYLGWAVR